MGIMALACWKTEKCCVTSAIVVSGSFQLDPIDFPLLSFPGNFSFWILVMVRDTRALET